MRLVGRVVELLDDGGVPRLRMAAPWLLDRRGVAHVVSVEVHGCVVDRDPRGPWDRELTPLDHDTCVLELAWDLPDDAYPLWIDPFWSSTNLMTTPRALHTATRLQDGRVLLAGGTSDVLPELATCELFDPESGTFASTAPLSEAKRGHRAVSLDDGRVIVVGGDAGVATPFYASPRVERYDPTTGQWTRLDDVPTTRSGANLVRRASGELLLTGGWDPDGGASVDVVELCAPTGESCSLAPPMLARRAGHAAMALEDGRVLVAGGGENVFDLAAPLHTTSELLDADGAAWSAGPTLAVARYDAASVLLPDGRVLLTGGSGRADGSQTLIDALELVDPAAAAGMLVGALSVPRWLHTSTLLPNGAVLSVGASGPGFTPGDVVTTELFDPMLRASQPAGALGEPTALHQATLLADGRVLVTGGFSTTVTDAAAVFGDALGTPCDAGDSASCPNGACVDGVCEASASGAGGEGSGGTGAVDTGASSPGGAASTGAGGAFFVADDRSFYGCSAAASDASTWLTSVGVLCLMRAARARVRPRGWGKAPPRCAGGS